MGKSNKNEMPKYLFHEGTNYRAFEFLGSFLENDLCTFRVWAPNAKKVYVTGDFCNWEPKLHKAKKISEGGIYEAKIKGVKKFDCYKYVFESEENELIFKSDPYAKHFETRPATSSKVYNLSDYKWNDSKWMDSRKTPYELPLNIYEVHLGSWKLNENDEYLSYREMANQLVDYVKKMNYTHIEILPIMEYPYDKSWGYQVLGFFAPTSRYGLPEDFMYLVDKLHQNNIGVILDWVPGHFPKDASGLCEFDGGYTYEYSDPYKMEHKSWGTRVFDFGRNEVVSFLISNASFWLEKYHLDGLRVDAVSSMLYLDYGREHGQWRPNENNGNENLEAKLFLQKLNKYLHTTYPNIMMIAEEATSWPKVTHPISEDGLGFTFKWNMGWMNDSTSYLESNPFFRKDIHNFMTFSLTYAFSENYVLPLSHDEVVHGKKSILNRPEVEFEDKFKNVRAFLGYMYAHPGKKLTFMGLEFGQVIEWNESAQLDWLLLDYPLHEKMQRFIKDLNKIYKTSPPLWESDNNWDGFKWNTVDDFKNNVFSFTRFDKNKGEILVVSNFSSQDLKKYKIGVSKLQKYKIMLNTDSKKYGGYGIVNRNIHSKRENWNEYEYCVEINLPPFSTLYLIEK